MSEGQLQVRCRALAVIWVVAVIAVSVQSAVHHTNNFEIFRTSWRNLAAAHDLYTLNASHQDYFKYSPTFALLFAPLAILPFAIGILLWNALNAGVLYWSIGRILSPSQAFWARAIVFLDAVGSMQNAQSNALAAGLMILTFADLERRREARAALMLGLGTLIKIFPILAGAFVVFRPYRAPRFLAWCAAIGIALVAAPLVLLSPVELLEQYRSWRHIQQSDQLVRGISVMFHLHQWLGVDWPNVPVQLAGVAILLAPLVRLSHWGHERFRLHFLASVLIFCVAFNHKAESPTFVIALAGVGIWFALSDHTWRDWVVLGVVFVATVLSSSDAMPQSLQHGFFDPYRIKVLPVLLVWVMIQWALWRGTASAPRDA